MKNLSFRNLKATGAICLALMMACLGSQTWASSAKPTEKRVALVIGNSNYLEMPLKNPINDSRAISKKLKQR